MIEFTDMPDDPTITNVFDVAPVAVWKHEGEPDGLRYVLDVAGPSVRAETLSAALATIPPGSAVEMLRA